MGNLWNTAAAARLLARLKETYDVYAPIRFPGSGCYSDTDTVRYGQPDSFEDLAAYLGHHLILYGERYPPPGAQKAPADLS